MDRKRDDLRQLLHNSHKMVPEKERPSQLIMHVSQQTNQFLKRQHEAPLQNPQHNITSLMKLSTRELQAILRLVYLRST